MKILQTTDRNHSNFDDKQTYKMHPTDSDNDVLKW